MTLRKVCMLLNIFLTCHILHFCVIIVHSLCDRGDAVFLPHFVIRISERWEQGRFFRSFAAAGVIPEIKKKEVVHEEEGLCLCIGSPSFRSAA